MNLQHPVALLLAQIGCVLLVSRLFGVAFRWLGQPLVVAEIVAGIALGPSLAGALFPEMSEALFAQDSLTAMGGVSQLGLVLFMFIVGLELDHDLVRERGRIATAVSLSSIALPFASGLALGWYLYEDYAPDGVARAPFILFCGASMSVTAFPVLARILGERRMLGTRVGALSLTSAAVDDVCAWCLLAFVIAVVNANGLAGAFVTTLLAVAFILVMLFAVRPFLARLEARFGTLRDLTGTGVAGVFLLLIASALVAELIGIHALFGAFIFGAVVPREGRIVPALSSRLEDVVTVLLLPLFFALTGLRTEIGLLETREDWQLCALVTAVAMFGKMVGAAVPAKLGGMTFRESATVGVLMNTRGLMELVILNIGLELGVLSPKLFAMLVIMAVVTTVITSPLIRLLYPPKDVLLEQQQAAASRENAWRLLTCVSHPESVPGLARVAAALCAKKPASGWALRLIALEDDPSLFPDAGEPTDEEDPANAVARLCGAMGAEIEAISFASADRTGDIVSMAEVKRADALLLGIHRPLVGEARLGGPLLTIAARAPSDVCMLRDNGLRQVRRVLLALGGSHDAAAQRVADRLAAGGDVELGVLDARRDARRVDTLLAAARGYDLAVVGVGSEWELPMQLFDLRLPRLLSESPCSVLIVHGRSQ